MLDAWLKVKPEAPSLTSRAVPIAPGYSPQHNDIERILRLFLQSDLGKMQLAAGAIASETLEADMQGLVSSLEHHFGVAPKAPKASSRPRKCCAEGSRRPKKDRLPPKLPEDDSTDTNGIELTGAPEAPMSTKRLPSADEQKGAQLPQDEKV